MVLCSVSVFFRLRGGVLGIVVEAVIRIGKRALKNNVMMALAAAAFVAIFFFNVPFPFIILAAAIIGFTGELTGSTAFQVGGGHGPGGKQGVSDAESALGEAMPDHVRPTLAR